MGRYLEYEAEAWVCLGLAVLVALISGSMIAGNLIWILLAETIRRLRRTRGKEEKNDFQFFGGQREKMNEESLRSLQAKLDEYHQWPCRFMFKFIVPAKKTEEVKTFFAGRPFTTRPSKNGRYVSFTAELEMHSSGEVIALYREAGKIEGIIAL